MIQVVVMSFGYLPGVPEECAIADIIIDVRRHLRDPHVSPEFRQLTGLDMRVHTHVLATPGALDLINGAVRTAQALLPVHNGVQHELLRIAVGCAGGRHRSVVLANVIGERLALAGWGVEVEHHHVSQPVVAR